MTPKQGKILTAIAKLNPDGTLLDIDQVINAVDYDVTKPAIQFSIRSMIKKGWIKKEEREIRRTRKRVVYSALNLGLEMYRRSLRK